MFKSKIVLHQYVLFGMMALILVWKLLFRKVGFDLSLLWWLLGMVFGYLFVYLDRFLYCFWIHPETAFSREMKEKLIAKKYKEIVEIILSEKVEIRELVMRSVLFLGVWLVLAVLTMTSSISFFARGFILGIGTHLVFDLVVDYFWGGEKFNLWFWQVKRKIEKDEQKWLVGIVVLLYLLLAGGL